MAVVLRFLFIAAFGSQPRRVPRRYRVVPRERVLINPARQANRVLAQEPSVDIAEVGRPTILAVGPDPAEAVLQPAAQVREYGLSRLL